MAENMAENNPINAQSDAIPADETPQIAAVRAAREAFFARARNGRAVPGAAPEAQLVVTPGNQAVTQNQRVGSGPSDAPVAGQSAQQRIASRNGGDGLLAVGVLSDLGSERAYRVWATGDSEDLKLITDPQAREKAFETIVDNMRDPQYREALSLVDYGLEREALRAYNDRPASDVEGLKTAGEMAQPPVASISSTPIDVDETQKSFGVEANVSTTLEASSLSLPKEAPVTPNEIVSPAVAAVDATAAGEPTKNLQADVVEQPVADVSAHNATVLNAIRSASESSVDPAAVPSAGAAGVTPNATPATAPEAVQQVSPNANSANAVEEKPVGAVQTPELEKAIEDVQAVKPIEQPETVTLAATDQAVPTVATPVAELAATTPEAISPDVLNAANPTEAVEENTIEVDLAPRRDRSLDDSSDEEVSEEEKRLAADKVAGRGPGRRLLDAFTRSLIGRDLPGQGNGNEISSPAVMTKDGYAVPEAVASRYVVRDGDFWRFDEKDPGNADNHKPKFTDKGPRLSTVGNDRGTVSDMVTVAQAKGWQQVTLKGSETFRRNAWIEANLAGMKTQGFNPKDQDRAMLEQARRERDALTITAGKRSPETPRPVSAPMPKQSEPGVQTPAAASAVAAPVAAVPVEGASPVATSALRPAQATPDAQITAQVSTAAPAAVPVPSGQPASAIRLAPEQPRQNVLLEHGAAPYKNDKDNAPSYFVSYSDPDGATQTVWGKDLERAVRESGVKPGDPLTLENLGSRPVTVNRPVKDAEGKVVRVDTIDTRLNVWDIQKQEKQSPGAQEPTATAVNVAALREQIEKALAGQPDNVVREVMDRLAERLQAGIAVQTEQQKAGAPAQDLKPAIDTRLAQVDVDREARQTVAEVAAPKRGLDQGVSKQGAPSMTR